MKKYSKIKLNLLITLAILIGLALHMQNTSFAAEPDKMDVHFIDVGQGDSTLIICGKHAMLIDAGDDSKGTAIQNYLKKQGVDKLDYLILTHPDADHIGGAPVVITKFEIKKVFVSNYEKDNKSYLKLIQALDNKNLKYTTPRVGAKFCLGTAEITFLAPNKEYDNPNDASIALIVENGDNRFIFSGDAGEAAEKDILNNGLDISADVYQVGHHGSKYSSSEEFLDAVAPEYAVISCGEGNSYGHPHAEVLNNLRSSKVKLYRTDEAGSIVATSDGKNISFSVPASETWKAGEPAGSSNTAQNKGTTDASKTAQNKGTAGAASKEQSTGVENVVPEKSNSASTEITYVLNVKTKKFHKPSCSGLPTVNRQDTSESRESVIAQGYEPCKKCHP
ncbi:MAG: MBL fold metallo-hydrolase [Lachnospiraceae bacterium]|nr:MBL fold metallo-hydrolase [Lachnospiraceae bacterium]